MASLSEKLRRERELRGISLKQISEDTKIGVRFLQALEEDKLELIPGEFYRRSYLRSYARYLGLDEDRAVNAYAFAHQEQGSDDESGENVTAPALPTWLPWVAVIVVLAVVAVLLTRSQSQSSPVPPALEAPAAPELTGAASSSGADGVETSVVPATDQSVDANPEAAASPDATTPTTVPSATPMVPVLTPTRRQASPISGDASATRAAEGALRLVVAVGQSCWLEIEADGAVVTTGLKEQGFRQEFTADDEVRLWLGNAGGVSFWVNDRPLRSLGRDGQVRKDLSITRDNFMDYVSGEAGPL